MEKLGTANLERKEGILAEKRLGLGGGKEQSTYALTAAYDQSKSSVTVFILLQVGEALTSNPAFGDKIFFTA